MHSGLSGNEAATRLKQYGPNEIPEKKINPFVAFFKWFISPITLMLVAAAVFSALFGKTFDALFIGCLIGLNYGIERWQEYKADNAIAKLKSHLTVRASVCRDGTWQLIDSRSIVPGDLVRVFRGNMVPADARIEHADSLQVNQSMITGESLPLAKVDGEELYSGSFVASGEALIRITKTGSATYFGEAITLVDEGKGRSLVEKDILLISHFLMVISIVAVVVLSGYFWLHRFPLGELALLDLSLLIAGIPIALPTVMTLILHVGALELTKKQVIVRRLSALDDLANVTLLLTDKTGTLTKNEIIIESVIAWATHSTRDVVRSAALTDDHDSTNPISNAILMKAHELRIPIDDETARTYTPADSDRKHATATYSHGGKTYTVANGAPQVVLGLCALSDADRAHAEDVVQHAAKEGMRILVIAEVEGEKEAGMELLGMLMLTDPLVEDAKDIISFLSTHGIQVKMQTGDNRAIAAHVATDLALPGTVVDRAAIATLATNPRSLDTISAFAEILPADKLTIVKSAEQSFVTAVTGDGVNDIPAIKVANVGIAVHNAVDALKSAADVILLSTGIGVIRDAFIEARKVFTRMYNYSVYRISESFRLIMTVFILGIVIHAYPLSPIQLILIAFLNDVPIISLAFNKVKYTARPDGIPVRKRFATSLLFGTIGVCQSILLFVLFRHWHLSIDSIQTAFFLKLVISGHMLIFVAHTEEWWWNFLPSRPVLLATGTTAIIASCFAGFGLLMTKLPAPLLAFVWGWAILWMQVCEVAKHLKNGWDSQKERGVLQTKPQTA